MIIKQNRSKARTRKEKKKSVITSMVIKKTVKKLREKRKESYCWQPRNDEKEQARKSDKKRKMDRRSQTLDERSSIFDN